MTRSIKTAGITATLVGLASPAIAHVGDHGEATSAHFLVEHGLVIGLVSLAVIAVITLYLRHKA